MKTCPWCGLRVIVQGQRLTIFLCGSERGRKDPHSHQTEICRRMEALQSQAELALQQRDELTARVKAMTCDCSAGLATVKLCERCSALKAIGELENCPHCEAPTDECECWYSTASNPE